jgi:hypothetical protein
MRKMSKTEKLCLEIADLDDSGRSRLLGMVKKFAFTAKKSPKYKTAHDKEKTNGRGIQAGAKD